MFLVKYSDNWADEIDVDGFALYSNEEEFHSHLLKYLFDDDYETYEELLEDNPPCAYALGSNEIIYYDSFNDLLRHFTFIEITNDEAIILHRLIGVSFGHFPV